MKHGFSNILYNHRNKNETIISVIKRLFGDDLTCKGNKTQNNYHFNASLTISHRITNLSHR